ncbi:transposable element Tcb2 transposase [Trichonephila clavipes]|nr:transposable element Tcb2 transposase [Trichonephila clavipes]
MPLRCFRRQYEQLSQFERGRTIGMMEAGWSTRRVARQLGRCSDCVVKVLGPVDPRDVIYTKTRFRTSSTDQSSRRPLHYIVRNEIVQPTASSTSIQAQAAPSVGAPVSSRTIRRCLAKGNWTAAEWNQVVLSDESRFNFSSDDNRVRVWRPRGERLNLAFALQRHTTPTAGVMVWSGIAYNTRSPLVLIRGTMTTQLYVHDILQSHVLPLLQRPPGAIFQQDNARPPTSRVSQDCLHIVTTLPGPARSPDLSPIEHIWDHLGRRVGHPTSLNEL